MSPSQFPVSPQSPPGAPAPAGTSRRGFLAALIGGAAAVTAASLASDARRVFAMPVGVVLPSQADPALHVLHRLTYGPRPNDVDHIRQIGIAAYLEEQLAPHTLDDSAADLVMTRFPILAMTRQDVHSMGYDGRVYNALIQGMIARAVHSRRQLYERMVEFWTDHFNVPADEYQHDLVIMHRDVIRRHALGRFRDLVIGTGQHPAMLGYLNQAQSDKDHPNENYARELMELHTMGVDGGYTERDVREAARALTGWTTFDGTPTGFYFDPEMHDTGAKTVLGHAFPADRGIEDGLHLMSLVVNHPATATYICRKLCVRFIADAPPQSIVDSAAAVWVATDGEIVPVLRHIFTSAEFMASAGQKLRRPLDFYIGAVRATGTTIPTDWELNELLNDLAQPPYGWGPPNGYPEVAGAWITSSGLLARWNTAQYLTHEAMSEEYTHMTTDIANRVGSPGTVGELVDAASGLVFGVPLSGAARAPFIAYAADDGDEYTAISPYLLAQKLGSLVGLLLASPMYQWR